MQYADFSAWQHRRVSSGAVLGQEDYWTAQLAEVDGTLELPVDRPRPAVQRSSGSRVTLPLPPQLAAAVHRLAKENGTSSFTLLAGCYAALLHRLTGEDDVVFGFPCAGRTRTQFEQVLGCFVNTLPLRIAFTPETSFGTLFGRVRDAVLAALDNQEVPFERIVQLSGVPRDPGRAPLVQAMFAYQRVDADTAGRWATLPAAPYDVVVDRVRLDLTLLAWDHGAGITVTFEYSTDLFDESTVRRFLDAFATLVQDAIENPDGRVDDASLLAEHDLAVYQSVNSTNRPTLHPTFLDYFDEHVRVRPDADALVGATQTLTYAQLSHRADRIAALLLDRGVARGEIVGLGLARGMDLIAAQLGTWRAAAAFLTLDPGLPIERRRFMAEDAGIRYVLVNGDGGAEEALSTALHLGEADRLRPGRAVEPIGPGDAAYTIYTSGSSGTPKGVCVEHRGLPSVVQAQGRLLDAGPGGRVLQLASSTFDASVFETVLALGNGAVLYLPEQVHAPPGPELAGLIDEAGITHMVIVPSALAVLPVPAVPPRVVCVVGEQCPPPLAARWAAVCDLHNLYGPTEATIWSTAARILPRELRTGADGTPESGPVPIGRPIDNTQIAVVNRAGRPQPIGVPGELWLGGSGVARGYPKRPEQTRAAFVPCPTSLRPLGMAPTARLYRTGNKVVLAPDGDLRFLGRIDRQVKVHGVRIEPGEVESALTAHPAVAHAAVMLRRDAVGDASLAAYVSLLSGRTDEPAALLSHLSGLLPRYAVPATVTVLPELPRTRGGKVDYRALPEPVTVEDDMQAPATPTEGQLADLVAEVLGLPAAGAGADFFRIGGDSLKAVRLASRAADLGLPLSTADVILHQSPRALARVAEQRMAAPQSPVVAPALRADGSDAEGLGRNVLEPTAFQQFALNRYQVGGDPAAYLIVSTYGTHGVSWDPDAFAQAWNNTIRDHTILRARFGNGADGRARLLVSDSAEAPFAFHDLTRVPLQQALRRVTELADNEWRTGFTLSQAPYLRSTLIRLPDERHAVLWTRQHMIMDGWSRSPVLESFFAHYDLLTGKGGEPPEPSDFGELTRALARLDADAARTYWRDRLVGFRPVTDEVGAGGPVTRKAAALGPQLTAAIRRAADRSGVTLYETLRAMLALAMAGLRRTDDVLFAQMASGRFDGPEGIDRLVGNTLRMVPTRFRLDTAAGGKPWYEWIRSQRADMLEAERHAHLPMPEIAQAAGLPADAEIFDSYLVNEQYPTHQSVAARTSSWQALGTIVQATTIPYRFEIFDHGSDVTICCVHYGPERAETRGRCSKRGTGGCAAWWTRRTQRRLGLPNNTHSEKGRIAHDISGNRLQRE